MNFQLKLKSWFLIFFIFFIFLGLHSQRAIAGEWKAVQDSKLLRALLPKIPTSGAPGSSVSARDLDDKYAYPCVDDVDEREIRSDSKYGTFPRLLLKNENLEAWICTDTENFKQISPQKFHLESNFKILLREKNMSIKVLANEAEILARPYDVDVKKSSVVLTKYLSVQSGKKTRLIPFTEMAIECPTSQCRVTSEKCIISADGIESKKVIGQFDKAVAEFKKHRGHLDDSKAFSYLDQLLVLAMSGDTAAISRFKKFPLEVDGGAAEIFETYKMYLQESESLNCAKKNL